VSVNVSDNESGVKNVTLCYRLNDGGWEIKPMVFNSTTRLYEAFIEGCYEGTKIEYMIIAYDNAGNKAQQDNTGQFYTFTIIPEFSLNFIIPMSALTLITILLTKKKRGLGHFHSSFLMA